MVNLRLIGLGEQTRAVAFGRQAASDMPQCLAWTNLGHIRPISKPLMSQNATLRRQSAARGDSASRMLRNSDAKRLEDHGQIGPKSLPYRYLQPDCRSRRRIGPPLANALLEICPTRAVTAGVDSRLSISRQRQPCAACSAFCCFSAAWFGAPRRIDVDASTIPRQRVVDSDWRRTKDGWQRADQWPGEPLLAESMESLCGLAIPRASLPHPLIVALLMLLPSLLFLFAFSPVPELIARTTPPSARDGHRRRLWRHDVDAGRLAADRSPFRDPSSQ